MLPNMNQSQVEAFQEGRSADLGAFKDGALKDDLMKDNILAKKEVNAEIKAHAGYSDQIFPSDFSQQSTGEMIKEKVANAASTVRDMLPLPTKEQTQIKEFQAGKSADFGAFKEGALNDDLMKDSILAKKEVNAEIKAHAGYSGQIFPSDFSHQSTGEMIQARDQTQVKEFQEGRSADFGAFKEGALKDDLMKDNILAKQEVNADIKAYAGYSDQILPSHLAGVSPAVVIIHDARSRPDEAPQSFTQMLKEKVTHAASAVKDMFPSRTKQDNFESSEEHRLADLGAFKEGSLKDDVMKDNILAKKEVNAEIQAHAGHSDQIHPSMLG